MNLIMNTTKSNKDQNDPSHDQVVPIVDVFGTYNIFDSIGNKVHSVIFSSKNYDWTAFWPCASYQMSLTGSSEALEAGYFLLEKPLNTAVTESVSW